VKPTPIRPKKITVQDMAREFGISDKRVRFAVQHGLMPGYKIGASYVFPPDAVEDFRHGRWEPQPRPVEPVRTLPQPADMIARKAG
jgi:hypothetical protein